MKKITTFGLVLLSCLTFLASCGNSPNGNHPDNKNQAYSLVMTSNDNRFGSLNIKPDQMAFYMPKKHIMVFFLGLEHNDNDEFIANTMVFATQENADGTIPMRLVAQGNSEHGFAQPHTIDTNVPSPSMYDQMTFLACNDSSQVQLAAAYTFMGDHEYVFLIPNDDATPSLEELLNRPQFAALKEFIDNYHPTPEMFPTMDEKQMTAYRLVVMGPDFLLNNKGIKDVITLGEAIESVAPAVEGLYDKVEITDEEDEVEGAEYRLLTFTLKGEEVMTAFSYDEKTIAYIMVTTPFVKYNDGNYLGCGDHLKPSTFYSTDDYGRLKYKGLFIDINDDGTIHAISVGEPLM